jgi:hypothetical protein
MNTKELLNKVKNTAMAIFFGPLGMFTKDSFFHDEITGKG